MYNKVLITLDGSPLAESALPYAAEITNTVGIESLMLLRLVVDGIGSAIAESDLYLQDQARRLMSLMKSDQPPISLAPSRADSPRGVQWLSDRVPSGGVAEGILNFVAKQETELLIMASHGATGLERWPLGSVAEQVLWSADIPILLVRPESAPTATPPSLQRLLVPLDGSLSVEQATNQIENVAQKGHAEVTALYIETNPETGAPGTARGGRRSESIQEYLGNVSSHLEQFGIKVHTKVLSGQPGQTIIDESKRGATDLVVISSAKLTGTARLMQGSVAAQVIQGVSAPVLLVPARERTIFSTPATGTT